MNENKVNTYTQSKMLICGRSDEKSIGSLIGC